MASLRARRACLRCRRQKLKLLHTYDESPAASLSEADAIPDGTPGKVRSLPANAEGSERVSILIGCDLPPPAVTWMLFDVFIDSVHWFMMIFHEPSLRADLEKVLRTGRAKACQKSMLYLIIAVLAIGARYAERKDVHANETDADTDADLSDLQSRFLKVFDDRLMDLMDQTDIGMVQTCILLSSLYYYHRQPRRSFMISGAATKGAQAMRLHKESAWGDLDPIEREVRRRVWWALFVSEGFTAMTFGSTCNLQDGDCQVKMPGNIDDNCATCPGFDSVELLEDGTHERVTTFTYQRLKFKLYRIASPITRDLYSKGNSSTREIVDRVQEINRSLLIWKQDVPPEMQPSSFSGLADETRKNPVLKLFHLQALSLQISYNNIQLILHRPLVAFPGIISTRHFPTRGRRQSAPAHNHEDDQHCSLGQYSTLVENSRAQCWESALRICHEYLEILRLTRNTHAVAYAGIQAFTAGVMLAIFALSQPFSAQVQEAKRWVGRLIKRPRQLGNRTAISDQSGHILEKLLRLILAQEIKMLTDDKEMDDDASHFAQTRRESVSAPSHTLDSQLIGASDYGPVSRTTDGGSFGLSQQASHCGTENVTAAGDGLWNMQQALDGNFDDSLDSLQHGPNSPFPSPIKVLRFPADNLLPLACESPGQDNAQQAERQDQFQIDNTAVFLPFLPTFDPFSSSNNIFGTLEDAGLVWFGENFSQLS
ncbi:hypothetical protein AYO22_10369 [Fonsecaea multimorphosa]|nr:hypothetical protein AYO22_10369 [Fonsecaea multimorphosa]